MLGEHEIFAAFNVENMNLDIEKTICLPPGIEILLSESIVERFNFLQRLSDEFHTGANTFSRDGEALYSCTINSRLVGVAGVNSQSDLQGRIRRFYISSQYRRQSVGSQLLKAIEADAFEYFSELVLYTDTRKAARFYEEQGYDAEISDEYSHRKRKAT